MIEALRSISELITYGDQHDATYFEYVINAFHVEMLTYNLINTPFCFLCHLIVLFPFRFFMEKQVMGEFVRILKISRTLIVSLQLLQTMSIMIQNLKSEHSICELHKNNTI